MFYILYSDKTESLKPELSYMGGTQIPIKKGWFKIFVDNTRSNIDKIEVEGELYNVYSHLVFKNEIKATITLYNLKLLEYKKTSFDFFFPTEYKSILTEYEQLVEKFPEYVV